MVLGRYMLRIDVLYVYVQFMRSSAKLEAAHYVHLCLSSPTSNGPVEACASCIVILCYVLCLSVRGTSCASISVVHAGAFIAPVDRGVAGHLVWIQETPW